MNFLKRHLSVSAKTIVKSAVKDFDEAVSKLIQVYGQVQLITARMLIEAEEKIIPLWRCLKESQYGNVLEREFLSFRHYCHF